MKVLMIVLRVLGLKRKPPTTAFGRMSRRCERAVTAVAGTYLLVYILLLLFPQVAFGHSIEGHGIQVYSTDVIDGDVDALLLSVHSRLAQSTLHRDDDTFRVYVCNNLWLYSFFAPLSRDSFATANPISQCIIVANADTGNDRARRMGTEYTTRSFSGVVTHEAGHVLVRRRFGILAIYRLPAWLQEGYCDMLAQESSFPEKAGDARLAKGESDGSGAFRYLMYRRMAEYLIRGKGIPFEDLVLATPDAHEVRENAREWIRCRTTEAGD